MSQCSRLLEHLKSGKMINRLSAFNTLGIFELSARIIDLEHLGHVIDRESYRAFNKYGDPIKGKNYWIGV